jgi:subtilisin family serine protease
LVQRQEVIVQYEEGAEARVTEAVSRAGFDVALRDPKGRWLTCRIKKPYQSDWQQRMQEVASLAMEKTILSISSNLPAEQNPPRLSPARPRIPNDELWPSQRVLLDGMGAPFAWHEATGTEVVVAIIDTGIDIKHNDLCKNIWTNPGETGGGRETNKVDDDGNGYVDDVHGWNFVDDCPDVTDDDRVGHGTHCAGIIGAMGDNNTGIAGVNWKIKLMPLKVLNRDGEGNPEVLSKAIDYAIKNGAKVINLSLEFYVRRGFKEDPVKKFADAIIRAETHDLLIVSGAGDGSKQPDGLGADIDQASAARDLDHYPTMFENPNILSVLAINQFQERTSYSNFGRYSVDIGAPGGEPEDHQGILSTAPGGQYKELAGTSQAAAHASGVAALAWGRPPYRKLTATQLKELLLTHSRRVKGLRWECVSGGRIDARFLNRLEGEPIASELAKNRGLRDIHVGSIPAKRGRSRPPVVAVIDTGVDYTHPHLSSFMWTNPEESGQDREHNRKDDDHNTIIDDVYGADFSTRSKGGIYRPWGDPRDFDGHGTHIAGIIRDVAAGPGEALGPPAVRVMALKITASRAGGSLDSLLLALDYAIDHGADIINCSFGFRDLAHTGPSPPLVEILKRAQAKGIVVICSAGNHTEDLDKDLQYPACIELDNVLTVMGVGEDDVEWDSTAHGERFVYLAAPCSFVSTLPFGRFGEETGTSMSAAAVSGALVRVWQEEAPGLKTALAAKKVLLKYVRRVDNLDRRCKSSGTLDLQALSNPTNRSNLNLGAETR